MSHHTYKEKLRVTTFKNEDSIEHSSHCLRTYVNFENQRTLLITQVVYWEITELSNV